MADELRIRRVGVPELSELAGFCLPAYPGGKTRFTDPTAVEEYPEPVQRGMYGARLEWLEGAVRRGLVAFLAGPPGAACGLVECLPIEVAPRRVRGEGLLFVTCLWVTPPEWAGRGVGRTLLRAVEEEARKLGKAGLATLAYARGEHKPAGFFVRQGYVEVDRRGKLVLLHRALAPGARPPRWHDTPAWGPNAASAGERGSDWAPTTAGRAGSIPRVDLLWSGQCPYFWAAAGAVRQWARARAGCVEFREWRTDDPAAADLLGTTGGVFVDQRRVDRGPCGRGEVFALLDAACGLRGDPRPEG